mgnify:CR=1 FL=1
MTTLVAWNCNMAFREKKRHVLQYDPDILVIPECEDPATKGDWSEFSDWVWVGENENKGLGVFARNGITLELADDETNQSRYVVPVNVDGAADVLAVWAMNDEGNPERRYIGQVYTALQQYRNFVKSDTVVAGDFNWNVVWDDSPKSPLCGNFSDTVEILRQHGLQSVYHAETDSEFGDEGQPTFFMHKKQERPYHTDYVFASDARTASISDFHVGKYDEWVELSDHMPILTSFEATSTEFS